MLMRYLKQVYKRLLLDIAFFLIFWLVFALSGIHLSQWFYPLLLCASLFLAYSTVDYIKFRRRLREIDDAVESGDFQAERFQVVDPLTEAYHRLIVEMNRCHAIAIESYKQSNQGHKEYLMLWSHQIKTPITALNLMAQKLDDPLPYREQLFHIERYVNMMLRFLKLDSLQNDLHIKKFLLKDSICNTVRYLRPLFLRSKTSVSIENCDIPVTSDPNILEFVLEQLLSNAIKYGGKRVSLYAENGQLVIADQGIGIDSAYLPLIWNKGFAARNSSLGQKSSGVGLYLVHEMLQALNHSISVESCKGEGTRFRIRF